MTEKQKELSSVFINIIGYIVILSLSADVLQLGIKDCSTCSPYGIRIQTFFIQLIFWPIQMSYHLFLYNGRKNEKLQRIDRASMSFLLASLFTITFYLIFDGSERIVFMVIVWAIAIVGFFLLIYISNLSRKLAPVLSFLIGIVGIVCVFTQISNFTGIQIFYFIIGALLMSLAGAVYAIKKPNPQSEFIGFHEIFHILLTTGVFFIYLFISTFN